MEWGKHPGRVREKLAALLLEHNLAVSPYDLNTQEGAYRSRYWDLCRWYTDDAKWADGKAPDGTPWPWPVRIASWSTMTMCVRHGVMVDRHPRDTWGSVEVEHAG